MFVVLFQVFACDVGVYLCGVEVAMAEQFFDGVDVAALVEDMCGEGVAEDVRAYPVGVAQ